MVTTYATDEQGKPVADIPCEGPCRGQNVMACRLVRDHYRHRSTGPGHCLIVVRCQTHNRGFTLYPAGYTPYSRETLHSGMVPDQSDHGSETPDRPPDTWHDHFTGTWFQAGLDAADGIAWLRENDTGSRLWGKRWRTQTRQLTAMTVLLGVDPDLPEERRQLIASGLDVGLLVLNDARAMITDKPGYRSRGQAVVTVLESLVDRPCITGRLLRAGYLAGLWGMPLEVKQHGGMLRSPPFRRRESRSPP